jgi:hypothetical protein
MMIIAVDNLNREEIADDLLVAGLPDNDQVRAKAQEFCDWLNQYTCDDYGGRFHRIVPNDYRLSRGMADLV